MKENQNIEWKVSWHDIDCIHRVDQDKGDHWEILP